MSKNYSTLKLTQKSALVTGASRGIGRAIAIRLAADGALVAVHYGQNAEAANETVRAIEQAGGKAFSVHANMRSLSEITALFVSLDSELIKRTGSHQLDILVNNAGYAEDSTFEDVTEEFFERHFDINAKGPFFVTQHALPRLKNNGRIINISSSVTRVAHTKNAVYGMSKAALDNLTLTLAKHLGPQGITVNSIHPGATDTDMINAQSWWSDAAKNAMIQDTSEGRLGRAEDIAGVAAFFASDDSHWVTGQHIEASGGFHL